MDCSFSPAQFVLLRRYFTVLSNFIKYDIAAYDLRRVMRKQVYHICKTKDTDQLRSNCAADQHLCFIYMDRAILLLTKSETSSLWPATVTVQPGLCRTWSDTPKTGFHMTRLIFEVILIGSAPIGSAPTE